MISDQPRLPKRVAPKEKLQFLDEVSSDSSNEENPNEKDKEGEQEQKQQVKPATID